MEVQWNQILLTSKQDSFHCRGEALHALQVWAPCVSADSIRAAACGGVTVSTGRVGNSFARGTVNRHGASAGREALFCNLCWMQPVVIYQTIRIEAQQSALCEPHTSVCRGRWFRTLRRTSRIYATCCCWPIITERYELFGVGSCACAADESACSFPGALSDTSTGTCLVFDPGTAGTTRTVAIHRGHSTEIMHARLARSGCATHAIDI